MITKKILVPHRLRKVPEHFSWIDHRLVRDKHFARCSTTAWTLYLFLVAVGDVHGMSYYSDQALCRHLNFKLNPLTQARQQLIQEQFVAFERPLYQVLDLSIALTPTCDQRTNAGEAVRVAELFSKLKLSIKKS